MSPKLSLPNQFSIPEINFPSNAGCSSFFNMIFQQGYSLTAFESYVKSKSISEDHVHSPEFLNGIQYNLKKDLWGIKEGILILKGDNPDVDVHITYAIRDANEWTYVVNYFEGLYNPRLIEEKPGHRVYQYGFPLSESNSKRLIIIAIRDTEQSSKIALALKF